MQPRFVAKQVVLDFSNPLQRDPSKRRVVQQQEEGELPTPESSTRWPRQRSPFGLSWERDQCNPYKILEPPAFVVQNQLFAVEFRLLFHSDQYLVVYFYARLQPDNTLEYPLACEPLRTGRLQRVPLFIANPGVYNFEIVIVPEEKSFRPAVYRHDKLITVLESGYANLQVGSYEHKVLLGFDKPERVGHVDGGNDSQGGTHGDVTNMDDLGSTGVPASEIISEIRDDIEYLIEVNEDWINQWLKFCPEQEKNNPEPANEQSSD